MATLHRLSDRGLQERIDLCHAMVRRAGALALENFQPRDNGEIALKGPQDYLTETDAAVERDIRRAIAEAFPEDAVFGEETGGVEAARLWVVDPIDGTANYARHNPHFCISLAFVDQGVVQFGMIYAPVLDELYFARHGRGAFRDGRRLQVARTTQFEAATIELGWSVRVPNAEYVDLLATILAEGANVRRAGSGALGLAYVADGRSDAYLEKHMNAWDCLAGICLVREAGGCANEYFRTGGLIEGGPVLASVPAFAATLGRIADIPLS